VLPCCASITDIAAGPPGILVLKVKKILRQPPNSRKLQLAKKITFFAYLGLSILDLYWRCMFT